MPLKIHDVRGSLEERRSLATLLAATFEGYPLTEWVVGDRPGPALRRERYFSILLDEGFRRGRVLRDASGQGAAVWFPPGGWAIGARDFLRTLPAWLRVTGPRALGSRLRGLHALTQARPQGRRLDPRGARGASLGTAPRHRQSPGGVGSRAGAEGCARRRRRRRRSG